MTEYRIDPPLPPDLEGLAPESGITQWAAFKHFAAINDVLATLTPLEWSVHLDPERPGTYYIAGAPETAVVAEGLTLDDANSIVFLVNELPGAIEHFEELSRMWDVLLDGSPSDFTEISDYLDTINEYQVKIAQLEGTPAVIPETSVAGDLTFMHVGHFLSVLSMESPDSNDHVVASDPILYVANVQGKVKVTLGGGANTTYILNPDEPVKVTINKDNQYAVLETAPTSGHVLEISSDGTA